MRKMSRWVTLPTETQELNHNRQEAEGGTIDRREAITKGKEPNVTCEIKEESHRVTPVTLELIYNTPQDADGGTIDS